MTEEATGSCRGQYCALQSARRTGRTGDTDGTGEMAGSERTPSQICQRADIGLETFYHHVATLEDAGLVRYTYVVGNGSVYDVE